MCGRTGPELKGWKDKVRIPVFGRITSEFQWLEQ